MARNPYRRRVRPSQDHLPEVDISEEGNIRSLHLGSPTVQSSMNLDDPAELVLSYSRSMMAWLLFMDPPEHITQIGLGGGSFTRWIDLYLSNTQSVAVEINPQVIAVARAFFELPFEGERFNIVEGDGAEYIKICRSSTNVIMVDGFDGEQIVDDLVSEDFFEHCKTALTDNGIFITNWWSGDKRYQTFVERLLSVFGGLVLEVPAASHGNTAVMAFKDAPALLKFNDLEKRAETLSAQYHLDFKQMLSVIKNSNVNNGKTLFF